MTETIDEKLKKLMDEKNAIVENMRKEHERVAELMLQRQNLIMEY